MHRCSLRLDEREVEPGINLGLHLRGLSHTSSIVLKTESGSDGACSGKGGAGGKGWHSNVCLCTRFAWAWVNGWGIIGWRAREGILVAY